MRRRTGGIGQGSPDMRILIADDHPVVRQGLKQILAADPEMNVVGEAKNGNEALALARSVEWDVAILDFSMPGKSGLELLKEIKRECPGRPVLVLSMYPEEIHATRVLKAGGDGYLNKGSASEELTGAIRKVMSGGKYVSPSLAEKIALELAPDAQKPLHEELSDREYRVLWLLASGKQAAPRDQNGASHRTSLTFRFTSGFWPSTIVARAEIGTSFLRNAGSRHSATRSSGTAATR